MGLFSFATGVTQTAPIPQTGGNTTGNQGVSAIGQQGMGGVPSTIGTHPEAPAPKRRSWTRGETIWFVLTLTIYRPDDLIKQDPPVVPVVPVVHKTRWEKVCSWMNEKWTALVSASQMRWNQFIGVIKKVYEKLPSIRKVQSQ